MSTDLADRDRRVHGLLAEAERWMQTRVKHPDGSERTAAETLADEKEQQNLIRLEPGMGSRRHYRLPRWQRWIPKFVLLFDICLLLYFFAGITNVDWQSPLSMNLVFATALAAMVTVLAYGFLAFPVAKQAIARKLTVPITGYAAPDGGTGAYNLALSAARARAVRARLIALGVPARQIVKVVGTAIRRTETMTSSVTARQTRKAARARLERTRSWTDAITPAQLAPGGPLFERRGSMPRGQAKEISHASAIA